MIVRQFFAVLAAAVCLSQAAVAADEQRLVEDSDELPTLFISESANCREDYAGELRAAGIETNVKVFSSLKAMAKFVNIPVSGEPKHLLMIDGIVVANHVPPSLILETLEQTPEVTGVIGSTHCATDVDHTMLDAEPVRFF